MSNDLIDIELEKRHAKAKSTLNELSAELQVKAIRTGLKYAGKPLVTALKTAIGRRSGFLAGLVNQVVVKAGQPVYASGPDGFKAGQVKLSTGEVGVMVGPNKQASKYAFIGMILESGAQAHTIGTQYGAIRIGGNYVGREVQHPGFKGKAIFAPALNEAGTLVENRFYEGLQRHLDRLLK